MTLFTAVSNCPSSSHSVEMMRPLAARTARSESAPVVLPYRTAAICAAEMLSLFQENRSGVISRTLSRNNFFSRIRNVSFCLRWFS